MPSSKGFKEVPWGEFMVGDVYRFGLMPGVKTIPRGAGNAERNASIGLFRGTPLLTTHRGVSLLFCSGFRV